MNQPVFNFEKAKRVYIFMAKTYRSNLAWLKTAQELGMTVGQLTAAWNAAKRGEKERALTVSEF